MADEPIILGQQIAAAHKAEAERIARGNVGFSPLSPDQRYDRWNGDQELVDPVRLPLDERISTLCRDFALRDAVGRSNVRRSLSLDDLYTLLTFSDRSAVFSLRTRDPQWLVDGLTAAAMIEIKRVDFRDLWAALGLLYAMFYQIGADPDQPFSEAAALAEPDVSESLLSFPGRPADHRTLQASCYAIVSSPGGPGLIRRGIHRYQPTVPLDALILGVARLLRADEYRPGVETGTKLPEFWLSGVDDRALATALASVVAGATAHGELNPEACSDHSAQMLVVFLVEAASESAAATLFRLANLKRAVRNDFSMFAAQDRRLFCLLIARSVVAGHRPFETQESILRFRPGIEKLLRECPHGRELSPFQNAQARLRRFAGRFFFR